MKTYWATYHYAYTCKWGSDSETVEDFGIGKFLCNKKDIKKEVVKHIIEDEIPFADLYDTEIVRLDITDCYKAIEFEI